MVWPIILLVPADVSVRVFLPLPHRAEPPTKKDSEVSQEAQARLARRCANGLPGILKEFFHSNETYFRNRSRTGLMPRAECRRSIARRYRGRACNSAPAGPPKIAVIGFQEAVARTNDFQRKFADLQKKYDPKREQLKTLSDEIASLQKESAGPGRNPDRCRACQAGEAHRRQAEGTEAHRRRRAKRLSAGDAGDLYRRRRKGRRGARCLRKGARIHALCSTEAISSSRSCSTPAHRPTSPRPSVDAYNVKSGIPAPTRRSLQPRHPAPASSAPAKAPAAH